MNKISMLFAVLTLMFSTGSALAAGADAFLGTWVKPDESTIPAIGDPTGDKIRKGREVLTDTYNQIGGGSNFMPPVSGNRLSCSSCHLDAGTAAYASPWSVVALKYAPPGPYSSRSHDFRTMEVRVNDCMQRSMNGIPLPDSSYEMLSIKAYWVWLASGMKVGTWQEVKGTGFLPVPDMTRAADPVRGALVYKEKCEACHQENGDGVWDADAQRHVYPAIFGPNSFNDGAGIYRLRSGVGFIYGNMPYGHADASMVAAVPPDTSSLISTEDAWDVMAYVMDQPRPLWKNRLGDWGNLKGPDGVPDWMKKFPDAGYPIYYPRANYADNYCNPPDFSSPQVFSDAKHKYGPWADMISLQNKIIAAYKAAKCP